jgi:DNA-directed RNA polymerase subunit E'/Rpb7
MSSKKKISKSVSSPSSIQSTSNPTSASNDSKVKKTSNITNPYMNTNLAAKVLVKPNQLDNNIYIHMKKNLRETLEGKCNKYGFIHTIHKLIEYRDGVMSPEDLSGSVIFDVKYSALVFLPTKNTNIVCKITNVENNLLTAQNGALLVMLKQDDINTDVFSNERGVIGIKKTNTKLVIDMYVVVFIRNIRFYTGDTMMISMGRLEGVPTPNEIETYFNPPKVSEDELLTTIKPEILEVIDHVEPEVKESNIIDL